MADGMRFVFSCAGRRFALTFSNAGFLTRLDLHADGPDTTGPLPPFAKEAERQIAEYFAGTRRSFDLALDPEGTDFQKRTWRELCRIPYGTTITYGELARRTGNAKASRAVGQANNRNPIPIIIPCHRVIGSNGTLTGYAGGLDLKRQLLELERKSENSVSQP